MNISRRCRPTRSLPRRTITWAWPSPPRANLDRAIAAFKEALEHNPKLYEAHFSLGRCYQKIDDAGRAYIHYDQACNARPQAAEPRYYMGLMHQSHGAHELAQRYFTEALRVDSTFVLPEVEEGQALINRSEEEVALWYYRLGRDLKAQGYADEAVQIYRALLYWRPQEQQAQKLLEELLARPQPTADVEELLEELLAQPLLAFDTREPSGTPATGRDPSPPDAFDNLLPSMRRTYRLVLSVTPDQLTVGEQLRLMIELLPAEPGTGRFELPVGATELTCFVSADGLQSPWLRRGCTAPRPSGRCATADLLRPASPPARCTTLYDRPICRGPHLRTDAYFPGWRRDKGSRAPRERGTPTNPANPKHQCHRTA